MEAVGRMPDMIGELILRFGSSESASPLRFSPGPVTVFVGPNNSGKSLLLREIEAFSELDETTGQQGTKALADFQIVDWIEPRIPVGDEARKLLFSRQYQGDPELDAYYGPISLGYTRVGKPDLLSDQRAGVQAKTLRPDHVLDNLASAKEEPSQLRVNASMRAAVFSSFLWLFTVRLDGGARLALTQQRPSGPQKQRARNHLQGLFQDKEARERLRTITRDAFDRYFTIDPTDMQVLRIRMAKEEPPADIEESLGQEAQDYFAQAEDIANLSDGIKAFTGLTATVMSSDYRVMLIDEPEAFLHPTLARKLGRHLTDIASHRQGRVLAATHSPDFLMGCVESGEVNVVRLTFQNETATARRLHSDTLRQMMEDPLLRSTGMLSGLFHEGVVVSEADTDRAIYQEVNQRLWITDRTGAESTLFVNAQEKSSVRRIVQPLREMGIPAAAIVDLDIVQDRTFNALLKAAFVPDMLVESCGTLRSRVQAKFDELGLEPKHVGIERLPQAERESAQTLLSNVAEYGVFVVPVGELEQWFPHLQGRDDRPRKSQWVPWVFALMSNEPHLFEVEERDVWNFMRRVGEWIANPERKGIPA